MSDKVKIAQCLIAALWADGEAKDAEWNQFSETTAELSLSQEEVNELRRWGAVSRSVHDLEVAGLSADAKKLAFRLAFRMITSDRSGGKAERDFLPALRDRLAIADADAKATMRDVALTLKAKRQG